MKALKNTLSPTMQEILDYARVHPDCIKRACFGFRYNSAIASLVTKGILIQTGTHAVPNGTGRLPVYKLSEPHR